MLVAHSLIVPFTALPRDCRRFTDDSFWPDERASSTIALQLSFRPKNPQHFFLLSHGFVCQRRLSLSREPFPAASPPQKSCHASPAIKK